MGKTLAILMLSRMLNETFPTLAVGKVVATTKGQPSPARFFGDIAESQRLPFTTIREPVKARNRVINSILLECEQKGGKRYLMLADEVQEWQEEEWSYLKDLGNLLAVQGVKLSVVGFAQTQLHAVRAKLLGRKDLLARFFKSIYNLGGLKGREDLEQVLQNMDDSRFDHPVRTGIPWSEFFMPKAYRSGWRLATEANELWAAFDHIHRNTVRTPVSEVLMSAVTLAVLSFFEGSEPEDSPNFHGTSTSWLDALARSNYAQDLGIAV